MSLVTRFARMSSVGQAISRPMLVATLCLAGAGFLAIMDGCTPEGKGGGPVTVPLIYTPQHTRESIKLYPGAVPPSKIYVGPFEDQRDKKDAIGENTEKSTPIPVLAGSDPAEFFRQTLAAQFKRAGLTVVDDPAEADRTVSGALKRFWVTEGGSYEADIDALIRMTDKSGAQKFETLISGHGQNYGRSLYPENYRETLSDAMVRLTYEQLLTNLEFQNALK